MKFGIVASLVSLVLSQVLGDFHEPVVNLSFDHESDSKFLANINHQSFLPVSETTTLILLAYSSVDKDAKFHHEIGFGFRKHFDEFAIGLNIVSNHFNKLEYFNHQFVPGFEFFWKDFQVSYNRYIPLHSHVNLEKTPNLKLFDVSEISVIYKISDKYEIGLSPYIKHQTLDKGISGYFGMSLLKNFKISISPYYNDDKNKGASISLGFNFGSSDCNPRVQKSHGFFYSNVASTPSNSTEKRIDPPKKEEPVTSVSLHGIPANPVDETPAFVEVVKKKADGDVSIRVR
jgi:hypothetical protein